MGRVPLLYGSRLVVADAGEDAVAIAPPPPPHEAIADVGAAVRDALRFPLAGDSLETIVPRGGRATILVEPPALPLPGSPRDPRQAALAAASDELERVGVSSDRQTILVAAGLARRPGRRTVESLVTPEFALRFRGDVVVHDTEDPDLVDLGSSRGRPATGRSRPGGDRRGRHRRRRADRAARRACIAARGVGRGRGARRLGRLSARSSFGAGVGPGRRARAYARAPGPADRRLADARPPAAVRSRYAASRTSRPPSTGSRAPASPARFRLVPSALRMRMLASMSVEQTASAAFGGPPSVAHAEALVRGIESGSAVLDEPLDTLCIGIPRTTLALPRERPNALAAAAIGPRLRTPALAGRLPRARGRHRDPRRTVPAPVRPPDAAAVPRVLPGDARGPALGDARRGRARSRGRPACARGLPRRPHLPPAAALRRLGRLPPGTRPSRRRPRRGLPGRDRRPPARLRPDARDLGRARRWPTASAAKDTASASCSRRRTSPVRVG